MEPTPDTTGTDRNVERGDSTALRPGYAASTLMNGKSAEAVARHQRRERTEILRYLTAARSPSTHKAYSNALARWHVWCQHRGVTALPATPQTLEEYLAHLEKENVPSTAIRTTVAAIRDAHLDAA